MACIHLLIAHQRENAESDLETDRLARLQLSGRIRHIDTWVMKPGIERLFKNRREKVTTLTYK